VATDCHLWPYRMSTNPFRKKGELSPTQKRLRAERRTKGRSASAADSAPNDG
jgi:hypothetical protein